MFLQKHFINQFNETVEEYVLDIDSKIMQRDCIPIILDTIHKARMTRLVLMLLLHFYLKLKTSYLPSKGASFGMLLFSCQ